MKSQVNYDLIVALAEIYFAEQLLGNEVSGVQLMHAFYRVMGAVGLDGCASDLRDLLRRDAWLKEEALAFADVVVGVESFFRLMMNVEKDYDQTTHTC